LLKKVDFFENKLYKKNSTNSSIPPSKDENRVKSNQSLREKTGKKAGGQKGHTGTTLKMYDKADSMVDHKTNYCSCCREQLMDEQVLLGRRQVIDMPPIHPIITEHRIYKTVCACSTTNRSQYPKNVASPISYGSTVTATVGYLSGVKRADAKNS
jgi:transposase